MSARSQARRAASWIARTTAPRAAAWVLAAVALAGFGAATRAEPVLTRPLFSGGGQLMTGGTIRLDANLGDALIGPASAGATELWSGFWTPWPVAPTAVGPAMPAPAFALDLAQPNPAATATVIQFGVPYACDGSLTLYDGQGRVVRRLFRGTAQPGTTRLVWDLRSDSGQPVPVGIYFYRLRFPAFSAGGKLAVLR